MWLAIVPYLRFPDMPFLTANKIHNGHGWLPENSVIEVSEKGAIISIQNGPHPESIFYEGILTPGFVNVHCHLELSHMKDVVPEHTGLVPFLKTIPLHRNDYTDEKKKAARHEGYRELLRNGTMAVGDIANTTDTLDVRTLGGLHVHTFVEAIGFNDSRAAAAFGYARGSCNAFAAQAHDEKVLKQSIVPHAPYSVSGTLFRMINDQDKSCIISIHNQESEEENKYYKNKEGGVGDLLRTLGIDDSLFMPTGRSSLQSYLEWMIQAHPFIFVHNTCSARADVQFAQNRLKETYWCLCPNANLYIENKLPDIDMLMSESAVICVGTDSLASNHQLSVLSELYTIKEHFPHITWEALLAWATLNGARALQMQDIIGSIEIGKKPGILQLTDFDLPGITPVVRRIL